ncbi:hypothetical protein BVC80_8739g4 [Macleaya cordata]|uniref:SANT/Myb domain n=1 Tax=Macleaya cordata TaxID=56857 RepID=A0A200QBP0_MACCD|nr:hypothetical protein BVC80_8739g4 [Macleaya cordata]
MVCKRPFGDEEVYSVGYKHPRHLEYGSQLASFVEIAPYNNSPEESHTSGAVSFTKTHLSDIVSELPVDGYTEFEIGAPGSLSSSWVTDSDNEKDSKSEAAVPVYPPDMFESDCPTRLLVQPEEMYSSHLDYAPRRLVAIGPNHQADIPVWGLKGIINASGYLEASDSHIAFPQCSDSDSSVDEDSEEMLMGSCVIPMPDADICAYKNDNVGHGLADCSCPDRGSVRCVRLHIMESRDKLRATLGGETFEELGFYEMGEVVARKWSEEEERVFHEVVFTNSASSGKSFWDRLSVIFPSRTKKDLVSYYYNVFMLSRRAEQNRLEYLDIDSDNDEWQGSDEEDDDELGTAEEDEDSVVESPQELVYDEEREENVHEGDEVEDYDVGDVGDDGCVDGEENDCSFGPEVQISCKNSKNGVEDNDQQDESCMSYDCQANREDFCGQAGVGSVTQENHVENDQGEYLQCSFDGGLNNDIVEHGYVLGAYDARVWDGGYSGGGLKEDVDFLPTFHMIEEVFGEEAWNNKGSDGKSK